MIVNKFSYADSYLFLSFTLSCQKVSFSATDLRALNINLSHLDFIVYFICACLACKKLGNIFSYVQSIVMGSKD